MKREQLTVQISKRGRGVVRGDEKSVSARLYEKLGCLDIYANILDYCLKPRSTSKILHNSNIVYPLTENYLSELRKLGFLTISQDNLKYVITAKGVAFLEKYLSFKLDNPQELKLTHSLAQLWSRFNLKQKRRLAYERLLDDLEVE